jgi:hypothetical protein
MKKYIKKFNEHIVNESKYVLYSAGYTEWNIVDTFNSKQEMLDTLINTYGIDELIGETDGSENR